MLFRLLDNCGNHREGDRIYKAGEAVESKSHLNKLWPNKFIRLEGIQEVVEETKPGPTKLKSALVAPVAKSPPKKGGRPKKRVDITDEFPIAKSRGLKVIRYTDKVQVVDEDMEDIVIQEFEEMKQLVEWLEED